MAVSRENAEHFISKIENQNIYCFEESENIYVYAVAALAHENFHFSDRINGQIQVIVESGLIEKWKDHSQLKKRVNNVNYPVPFSIDNVAGAFTELAVGVVAAIVAFLLELYFESKRRASRNSQPSVWLLVERIMVSTERNAWQEIQRYLRWKLENKDE